MNDRSPARVVLDTPAASASEDLAQLLDAAVGPSPIPEDLKRIAGVVVGAIVGFAENSTVPLVTHPGQSGSAAQRARATLDLHASHIGKSAVMMFEDGDPARPIIVGCLHEAHSSGLQPTAGQVEVDADGQRIVVSAKERIVLRCGKASITLTKDGKLILQGEYVSNQSSGVLRLKGGSVQIN